MKREKIFKPIFVLAISALFIITACEKDKTDLVAAEIKLIEQFMSKYGFDMEPRSSGLYFEETVPGNGNTPVRLDTVSVYYTGYFLSGLEFDSNIGGDLFTFVVGNYPADFIAGWDEGLTLMTEGGEAMMIIPSWLAYGTTGRGDIPGYTPLFFEVELVSITPGPNH